MASHITSHLLGRATPTEITEEQKCISAESEQRGGTRGQCPPTSFTVPPHLYKRHVSGFAVAGWICPPSLSAFQSLCACLWSLDKTRPLILKCRCMHVVSSLLWCQLAVFWLHSKFVYQTGGKKGESGTGTKIWFHCWGDTKGGSVNYVEGVFY